MIHVLIIILKILLVILVVGHLKTYRIVSDTLTYLIDYIHVYTYKINRFIYHYMLHVQGKFKPTMSFFSDPKMHIC